MPDVPLSHSQVGVPAATGPSPRSRRRSRAHRLAAGAPETSADRPLAGSRAWTWTLAAFALLLGAPAGLRSNPDPPDLWELLARQEPRAVLDRATSDAPADRFARAMAMLALQPRTASHQRDAIALLNALADTQPATGWSSPARYYLGRIAELGDAQPRFQEAARHYLQVYTGDPASELAQIALVRYALVRVHEPVTPEDRSARLRELESLGEKCPFTFAPARRDFHLTLALAYCYAGDQPAQALRHSLAAEEAGIVQLEQRSTNLLRIAELARLLGNHAIARAHYRRFLELAVRDGRARYARDRLLEVGEKTGEVTP